MPVTKVLVGENGNVTLRVWPEGITVRDHDATQMTVSWDELEKHRADINEKNGVEEEAQAGEELCNCGDEKEGGSCLCATCPFCADPYDVQRIMQENETLKEQVGKLQFYQAKVDTFKGLRLLGRSDAQMSNTQADAWTAYQRAKLASWELWVRLDDEYMGRNPQLEAEGEQRYLARIRALEIDDPRWRESKEAEFAALEAWERVKSPMATYRFETGDQASTV